LSRKTFGSVGSLCLLVGACAAPAESSLDVGPARPPAPITLFAEWQPVVSSTYDFMNRHVEVAEIMSAGARTPEATYAPEVFLPLLPSERKAVGDVWTIDVSDVLPFLRQLHPSATPKLRHVGSAVEGGRATLLSRTREELEVLLRVHCEFELVAREMYLLPAQFEGRLLWDRVVREPKAFHLALPPRDTNFDVSYGRSVDIGFIPRMQVASANARPARDDANGARARLREAFYGPQVEWRPLGDALARAQESGKRLHVMQLFGTLDDESC